MIFNQVFTFDAKGNILDVTDVEGFPQKKVAKPADVTTQGGLKALVEDFFSKNFVDITARKTIEWGDPVKEANGNVSIRYKYEARIWDKNTVINNQIFTFDPKGTFVSVKDVEGFPTKPDGSPTGSALSRPKGAERVYEVNKKVSAFPEQEDLSTPEAAYAAIQRAYAAEGDRVWPRLSVPDLAEDMADLAKAPKKPLPNEAAERFVAQRSSKSTSGVTPTRR